MTRQSGESRQLLTSASNKILIQIFFELKARLNTGLFMGSNGGHDWDRTSDPLRLYPLPCISFSELEKAKGQLRGNFVPQFVP